MRWTDNSAWEAVYVGAVGIAVDSRGDPWVVDSDGAIKHRRSPLACPAGYRYKNQGDGTVLDCNTGLYWLRNSKCWGYRTWEEGTLIVKSLASDMCGLLDGSQPGDWRLPTGWEFCSGSIPLSRCGSASAFNSVIQAKFINTRNSYPAVRS